MPGAPALRFDTRGFLRCSLILMVVKNFETSLSSLKNGSVSVSATEAYPEPGMASVHLLFSNGSKLRAEYWRITIEGRAGFSSFDHQQKYGVPSPIDAITALKEQLQGRIVTDAHLDSETGDLVFQFAENIKFRVFNFTSYEIWEISFPGGTVEYSNFNK